MRASKTDGTRPGKLARRRFRVSEAEADHCERFLDKHLGQILAWGEGGKATDRATLVREIGRNLVRADGRTFVEQLYLVWRAARESRARVNELRARARRLTGARTTPDGGGGHDVPQRAP